MDRPRLRTIHQRSWRVTAARTIDIRLVRKASLLLVPSVVILALAVSRPEPLPAPPLPPSFDGSIAASLARELAAQHPVRTPGSAGAGGARRWLRDRLSPYGFRVQEDAWVEDVQGLGPTRLRNLSVVIPGTLETSLVFVAHLDNDMDGGGDNATGVAALIELARAFAVGATANARPRRPLHRLVFLWTDGEAHGSLGARRFAARESLATTAVVLDGVAGGAVRISVSGERHRVAAPALVRTVAERIAAETGVWSRLPSIASQLVALGVPAAGGEHAVLLGRGIATVSVSTGPEQRSRAGADIPAVDAAALGRLGAGLDSALTALDAAVQLPRATAPGLHVGARAVPGWALQVLLLCAVAPFLVATLDLLSRCRRRGIALAPAVRGIRCRAWPWLGTAGALWVGVLVGELPGRGAPLPVPSLAGIDPTPLVTLAVAGIVWVVAAARAVLRREHAVVAGEAERAAGWAVALTVLLAVAILVAAANPFTLVFLVPSLAAWLILAAVPPTRAAVADCLFGFGLAGPCAGLAVVGGGLELGARTPLYLAAQLTTGAIPWLAIPAAVLWAAAAGQVAALARGSYAETPPSRLR